MATKEQIQAIAKLIGQQTTEMHVLQWELNQAFLALKTQHERDMMELQQKLGLAVVDVQTPAVTTSLSPALPPGIAPGMTAADIPAAMFGTPPENVEPGEVVPITSPSIVPTKPGSINIPRPLKDRK